jgi:hypothetical protein
MIESSSRNGVAAGKSKPNPMAGAVAAGVLALALAAAAPAHAADGCTVLLCLAAPSWRAIDQCVPPVREVLRDLARGRPFPVLGHTFRRRVRGLAGHPAPAVAGEPMPMTVDRAHVRIVSA